MAVLPIISMVNIKRVNYQIFRSIIKNCPVTKMGSILERKINLILRFCLLIGIEIVQRGEGIRMEI